MDLDKVINDQNSYIEKLAEQNKAQNVIINKFIQGDKK